MTNLTKTEEKAKLPLLKKELKEVEAKIEALIAEDRTKYAQGIIDKMFNEFKKGAAWTKLMAKYCEEKLYVYSPGNKSIIAQQVRRGSNAPVQGFASEVGVKGSRLIMESYYKELPRLRKMLGIKRSIWDLRVLFNRIVHDALYYSVAYELVIPFIHIMQYEATYGVARAYEKQFNVAFTVEPEIEIEVSARDDKSYKWDWSTPNLVDCIRSAVIDAEELGILQGTVEEVMTTIFKAWEIKELRDYLQEHYPLLNVKDLDTQIKSALGVVNERTESI